MILNDLEYQVTKERIEGFERALALLNAPDNDLKKTNPISTSTDTLSNLKKFASFQPLFSG